MHDTPTITFAEILHEIHVWSIMFVEMIRYYIL